MIAEPGGRDTRAPLGDGPMLTGESRCVNVSECKSGDTPQQGRYSSAYEL